MIPERFSYLAPSGPEEAVAALAAAGGSARILSGGTWLVPDMGRSAVRPTAVIDLRAAGLDLVEPVGERLRVGAACSYADLLASPALADKAPLLLKMAAGITGGRQIRVQGTIGGSACAARPSSDAPTALLGQGGEALIIGPGTERRLPLEDFFVGAERTALAADEMLTGFDLELHPGASWGYHKLKHSAGSWPIATAAARISTAEDGACSAAGLVLGGVGERPVRVDVATVLVGQPLEEGLLREAAELASSAVPEPYRDELASGEYRQAVAAPVALRALRDALLAGGVSAP